MYDIIIIGAGPAGISAAIYGKSRGKRILMLEKNQVGGLIGTVSTVTHYTAIMKEESGKTFAERMKEQALSAGVEIRYENVTAVSYTHLDVYKRQVYCGCNGRNHRYTK